MSDNNNYFTPMEIDGIGEILNISLGSSATAMSDMLGRKVTITTPNVKVRSYDEFEISEVEPAVGVEITYVTGLSGNNLMLLRKDDVRKILEILMYTEIDPETFELDELSLSAVCELMNQMMGASATALADVIGTMVNISTPVAFEVEDPEAFKEKYFSTDEPMVEVYFNIEIEDTFSSKFITMLSIDLCKKLISSFGFMENDKIDEQGNQEAAKTENVMNAVAADAANAPVNPSPAQPVSQQPQQPQMQMQQGMPMQGYPQQMYAQPQYTRDPRLINVQPVYQNYEVTPAEAGTNLDLIMKVPLQVSVEIGRTKKLVKEILELGQGSLVVLDKLAGDQVDVYVNGQCIAKGDVVVVDDNFGVRITEVIKKADLINSL
ncbi:flagellar motor switch phosphatase FliY [Aminipila terrae]|uniref:Flagellar motor switch phosphatase FliY n=1 Tax=Aminipila terrae TaxID=2697030 RepID=A0A6P1MDI2_9FIRM|nr:flagellar motor switch phosphatase FliY [Aminipila terrae]QHI71967.1 flagellar motor switch phosphatase FliY [Aminipila terrae]